MKEKILPYVPGIALFIIAVIISFSTYKQYGMSWDETYQRKTGTITYNYVTKGDTTLFSHSDRNYGTGFELPLIFLERSLHLQDTREVFFMRHLVTHLFFLIAALAAYILVYRQYRNWLVATIAFLMLVLQPRIYAHSFFNTKDIPFLCMSIIILAVSQWAFDKRKILLFALLGIVTGYATSIRVMGVMMMAFVLALFLGAWLPLRKDKAATRKIATDAGVFMLSFLVVLYAAWPYLWHNPINNFFESYEKMSHFDWQGKVLIQGQYVLATELDWTYFPIWFFISNPILWLVAGITGLVLIMKDFVGQWKFFFRDQNGRNILMHLFCFCVPIIAVIKLHSSLYDDWRHLYFVYPAFVLMAAYALSKLLKTKLKWLVVAVCGLQAVMVGWFMVANNPHQQVYFNELVSHADESLRENYELDYWGPSFKQALEHLAATDKSDTIRIASFMTDTNFAHQQPMAFNLQIINPVDRRRFKIVPQPEADYFITNFRWHPEDYPSTNIAYNVKVLNSSIMRVYRLKNNGAKK